MGFLTKRVLGRESNDGKLRSDLEGLPFELYTTGELYYDGQSFVDKGPPDVRMKDIIDMVASETDEIALGDYIHNLLEDPEPADQLLDAICSIAPKERERLLNEFFITEPLFEAGGELLYPQELAALILMEAKRVAEDHLKKRIKKCVIAIPAYFTHSQRQTTRDAARIAGLEVVRLVNEPSAAAIG
jgi:hypothetical protein